MRRSAWSTGCWQCGCLSRVIIITAATMSVFRGLSLVVDQSRPVVPPDKTGSILTIFQFKLFGFVLAIALFLLAIAACLHLALHHTCVG